MRHVRFGGGGVVVGVGGVCFALKTMPSAMMDFSEPSIAVVVVVVVVVVAAAATTARTIAQRIAIAIVIVGGPIIREGV